MNKVHSTLLFIALSCCILSCSNEVLINLPDESEPVIHFVLDPFEDNYYAIVTKSGLADESIFSARDSSELFYPSQLELKLELWNDSVRLWNSDFHMIETNKELGFFPQGTGFLYQSNQVVPRREITNGFHEAYPAFSYFRIILNSPDFIKEAYSRVPFANYPVITQPHFADHKVRLYGPTPMIIGWETYHNIRYFDSYFLMHYEETDRDGNISLKSHQFLYALDVQKSGEAYSLTIDPDQFFIQFAKAFPTMHAGIKFRKLLSFDAVVVGGDENFESYLTHQKGANESSIRPWTNITNGLGVFALKYRVSKDDFRFHSETKDSLSMGRFTKDLGFVRW